MFISDVEVVIRGLSLTVCLLESPTCFLILITDKHKYWIWIVSIFLRNSNSSSLDSVLGIIPNISTIICMNLTFIYFHIQCLVFIDWGWVMTSNFFCILIQFLLWFEHSRFLLEWSVLSILESSFTFSFRIYVINLCAFGTILLSNGWFHIYFD